MLLLALLLGCIEGSAWPSRGDVDFTTAADTGELPGPPSTPTLPCNRADEGTLAQLTIQNPNPVAYEIGQMDPNCIEQPFLTIGPSDGWTGQVGNHLFFTVREANGDFVRFFGLPSGTQVSWTESLP